MNMRVLIADRNARLLESIARTFAPRFSIQTATTHERCNELLLRCEFDLAVISEKLADAPGLQLVRQIARDSPDTLRVFAARKSRLQLLKGKLGPFGLFRTLAYPIDPQELLSALTLAHSGLGGETRHVPAPPAVPVPARPAVERISLTSADAMFTINVPMMIAAQARVRRSRSSAAPRPTPAAPRASAPRQTRSQSVAPQSTPTQQPAPQPAFSQPAMTRAAAPLRDEAFQHTTRRRKKTNGPVPVYPQRPPMRTKLVLGATVAGVFLVTTFTLNLFDANVHVTRASTPRPEIARSDIPAPPPVSTSVMAPAFAPAPRVAARRVPSQEDEPANPQVAASTAPAMADPSSFGSEAYEPTAAGY